MLAVWATNKSLFANLSHSCPPLEISRHLISATGVYWIAILIAYAALTEYFFTWGWRKVRRQGADQSVMWSSSDHDRHDRHPSWSSSVTCGFALDLRKPHRKKKTGCNYYCICASQLQPSKTQPRWVFQSALLFWNHLKITYAPSLRKFDNSTREFILQNKWPLSLFEWSRDTASLMCLKIDTSPPFSAKG